MKTSHLKTISTCGLAALCLIAVGPAITFGQPTYAPIDLSTNTPAATTPTATDAPANVTVTTNSVAAESNTTAPAAAPATPAADVAAAPAGTTTDVVVTTNAQPVAAVVI